MQIGILELIGYLAPVIILVSMTMNSIVKFRWINLVGAATFCIYGYFIHVIPVCVLNGMIALIDIYYLINIYSKKEVFETLEITPGSEYLQKFIDFHHDEIQKICPGFVYNPDMNTISFYILRNMAVAGIFLAHREKDDVLVVGLDYVIPEYRDFKNGRYVYYSLKKKFIDAGYKTIKADRNYLRNDKYFKKLGFKKDLNGQYSMKLH
ncbi:MAG: hypothetical protein WAQ28_10970 [Bacteroidia bacterium]